MNEASGHGAVNHCIDLLSDHEDEANAVNLGEVSVQEEAVATSTTEQETTNTTDAPLARPTRQQRNRQTLPPFQKEMILKIRRQIEAGTSREFELDWTNVMVRSPAYGKNGRSLTVEEHCLKPVAVWMPHLAFARYSFMPHCPHCNSEVTVGPTYRWTRTPMVLYSVVSHKYLDTVEYKCDKSTCSKWFKATNCNSIKLHRSNYVRSNFRIRLFPQSGVDELLFSLVERRCLSTVSEIVDEINGIMNARYLNDALQYYLEMGEAEDMGLRTQAPTIRDHFSTRRNVTWVTTSAGLGATTTRFRIARQKLERATTLARRYKENARRLDFKDLKSFKRTAVEKYKSINIASGRDLLEFCDNNQSSDMFRKLFNQNWKATVGKHTKKIKELENELEGRAEKQQQVVNELEEEVSRLDAQRTDLLNAQEVDAGGTRTERENQNDVEVVPVRQQIDVFPDQYGRYNARKVSAYMVENIQHSIFLERKPGMVHRMTQLGGEVLSIDWAYKPSSRIIVNWNDTQIRPWKAMTTIMNEDNMLIWWGFLQGSESVVEIKDDLSRLRERIERVNAKKGHRLQAIYVDNCCNVRESLQSIFGEDVEVLLDFFHWLQRWDDIFQDTKSEEARAFKRMITQCVLVATDKEYKEKEAELNARLKRPPKVHEVLKKCRRVTANADDMEKAIRKVVQFFLTIDAERATATTTEDNKPGLILKSAERVAARLRKQLKHTRCLCDPSCGVHTEDGKSSRGTNKNERLNLDANRKVLFASMIGLGRAERNLWTLFDFHNQKANIARCGAANHGSYNVEKLAAINSACVKIAPGKIHFADVSLPTVARSSERLGFELQKEYRPTNTLSDSQDSVAGRDDTENEHQDVALSAGDPRFDESASDESEDEDNDVSMRVFTLMNPQLFTKKKTMEVFKQVTGNRPWIPFPNDKADVAEEEHKLFLKMRGDYNLDAPPSSKKGYKAFRDAWDIEVGNRFQLRIFEEDATVVMIHRKSVDMLREYCKKIEEAESASTNASVYTDARAISVRRTLKRLRQTARQPIVKKRAPIQYPQASNQKMAYLPAGSPFVLHSHLAMQNVTILSRGTGSAPYHFPTANIPRSDLKINKQPHNRSVCKNCGRLAEQHILSRMHPHCKYTECAKCGRQKYEHENLNMWMGYACQFTQPYHRIKSYVDMLNNR